MQDDEKQLHRKDRADRDAHIAVAGATSGVGLAIARRLAPEAASLSVCGRDPELLASALSALGDRCPGAHGMVADVTNPTELRRWLGSSTGDHRLDVLVATVGGNSSPDRWDSVFAENLFWVVEALHWAEEHLSDGGAIVLVSSVAARLPQLDAHQAAYGASKVALEYLTTHAAHRLGGRGIRVNAVAPGPILVPGGMWERLSDEQPDQVVPLQSASAIGRLVTAAEVAECVAFLSSSAASGVTGAVLRCDAGFEPPIG